MTAPPRLKARLTEGSVEGQLAKMALPMIGGIFAMIAFNLADTWFVSRLGTIPLAAMAFTFPVVMIFMSLSIGLGAGTSSVLARALGRADDREIRRLATDGMILATLLVIALAALGLATIDPFFSLLGADDETLPLVRQYMVIWYWGVGFLIVPMVGAAAIRATGNTKMPSLIMMASALINVILDPILIFGFMGLPGLELRGAAIATVVSRAFTLVASLWVLHRHEHLLTLEIPTLRELTTSWRRILHVGLPAAATNMVIPATMTVVTPLIASFGADAVAAFGAASRIEALSLIFFFALSAVIGPFVGQNFGARRYDRIRRALRSVYLFCLGFGLFLVVGFVLFGRPLAGLFSGEPRVIEIAAGYLLIMSLGYGMHGVVMSVAASCNSLGRPISALSLSLIRMLALFLPLAWLGSRIWGINGIWIGAATANVTAGAIGLVWSYRTTRDASLDRLAAREAGTSEPSSPALREAAPETSP